MGDWPARGTDESLATGSKEGGDEHSTDVRLLAVENGRKAHQQFADHVINGDFPQWFYVVWTSAKPRVRSHQPSRDKGTQLGLSGFGHGKDEKVLATRSDHCSQKSASYEDAWLRENDQTYRSG